MRTLNLIFIVALVVESIAVVIAVFTGERCYYTSIDLEGFLHPYLSFQTWVAHMRTINDMGMCDPSSVYRIGYLFYPAVDAIIITLMIYFPVRAFLKKPVKDTNS